jgi:hypothetical protein
MGGAMVRTKSLCRRLLAWLPILTGQRQQRIGLGVETHPGGRVLRYLVGGGGAGKRLDYRLRFTIVASVVD